MPPTKLPGSCTRPVFECDRAREEVLNMNVEVKAYLIVPVGEGRGLIRWAMLSGMLMVRGEICGWTAFTGDSGVFLLSFLLLDRAVNVILMFVLGKRNVHLENREDGICGLIGHQLLQRNLYLVFGGEREKKKKRPHT